MSKSLTEQNSWEERLRFQFEGYHASAMIYAAAKLGLPDRMGTGRWTAEQLAKELALSPPHLHRFLRGLSALGVCEELSDKTFSLAAAGHALKSGSPSRLREKVMIVVEQYWQPWANLVYSLRTGSPAFEHVFGMGVWDWRRLHPEQGARFDSYLVQETFEQAGPIVQAPEMSEANTVADIGGGGGALIAAVLRAHSHIVGILFDRPQTVEAAKPFLRSLGVAERTHFVAGDFLAEVPVRADLYLLKSILHDWEDAECRAILKNCRAAMPDDAKMLVIERLLPERALDDPATSIIDLHMMTVTGGRERSLEQFRDLLAQSELALSDVASTPFGFSIIKAIPA